MPVPQRGIPEFNKTEVNREPLLVHSMLALCSSLNMNDPIPYTKHSKLINFGVIVAGLRSTYGTVEAFLLLFLSECVQRRSHNGQ